jgi:hypothetical protein
MLSAAAMTRNRKPSGRGYRARPVETREPLQRFLIVCEGAKTEPLYFQTFHAPAVVLDIYDMGFDPLKIVQEALAQRTEADYDQVWVVFDRDEVPADRFNQALNLAKRNHIRVAYSNQAFELWFLLHFQYCDVALTRQDYVTKLSKLLARPYGKKDLALYQELESRQNQAIQHAQRLQAQYNPANPAVDDPCTTVHLLVQELRKARISHASRD